MLLIGFDEGRRVSFEYGRQYSILSIQTVVTAFIRGQQSNLVPVAFAEAALKIVEMLTVCFLQNILAKPKNPK